MKINKNSEHVTSSAELGKFKHLKNSLEKKEGSKAPTETLSVGHAQKIELGLSQAIRSELDPLKILEERKAKVDKIKELVLSNRYNAPTDAVAGSVKEEIDTVIALGNKR